MGGDAMNDIYADLLTSELAEGDAAALGTEVDRTKRPRSGSKGASVYTPA